MYQFYNISESRLVGTPRATPFSIDGRAPSGDEIPSGCVEVLIIQEEEPSVDWKKKAIPAHPVMIDGVLTLGWDIVDKDEEEIAQSVPRIDQRQMRLWLVRNGKLALARSYINGLSNEEALIEWQTSPVIRRNHPLVTGSLTALSMTSAEMDQAFIEASDL